MDDSWQFEAQRCSWIPVLGVGPQHSLGDTDLRAKALFATSPSA